MHYCIENNKLKLVVNSIIDQGVHDIRKIRQPSIRRK